MTVERSGGMPEKRKRQEERLRFFRCSEALHRAMRAQGCMRVRARRHRTLGRVKESATQPDYLSQIKIGYLND